MQQQAVGRDQQHLEEDEQVEQVAGQEGAVEPDQLELEQRVEMRVRARSAPAQCMQQRRQPRCTVVSSTISADSRSSTSTMPNGAGQSPSA